MKNGHANALFILAAIGVAVLSVRHHSSPVEPAPTPVAAAGNLLTQNMPGADGHAHTLNDWTGNVRVVNFWATWCPPCRAEIPGFIAAQHDWAGRGVEVIGIAVDDAGPVRAFSQAFKINYPLLVPGERIIPTMQEQGNVAAALPFTLLIDANGKIIRRQAGELSASDLQSWLQDAVK